MTGYERVNEHEKYFSVEDIGSSVYTNFEHNAEIDKDVYANANYYSDKTVAENNARADKLMRQLRRFAVEHNDCELDWDNYNQIKYCIDYDYYRKRCTVLDTLWHRYFGQISFSSDKIAEQAIKEFKDELVWYFTEYCDHFVDNSKKVKEKCGCELCHNDNLSNVGICDNQISLFICNSKPSDEQRLKYCPKCGRKLED